MANNTPNQNGDPRVNQSRDQIQDSYASSESSITHNHQMNRETPSVSREESVSSSDINRTSSAPNHQQSEVGRSQKDYDRQQEAIRDNQSFGESSLEKVSDRENQRNKELKEDEIAPKKERGYDIAPTAIHVKL